MAKPNTVTLWKIQYSGFKLAVNLSFKTCHCLLQTRITSVSISVVHQKLNCNPLQWNTFCSLRTSKILMLQLQNCLNGMLTLFYRLMLCKNNAINRASVLVSRTLAKKTKWNFYEPLLLMLSWSTSGHGMKHARKTRVKGECEWNRRPSTDDCCDCVMDFCSTYERTDWSKNCRRRSNKYSSGLKEPTK